MTDITIEDLKEDLQDLDFLKPHLYKIILLNDDYTPISFVEDLLQDLFFKTKLEAKALSLEIHEYGRSIVAKYPLEVANMKVNQVHELAKINDYPLKAIIEKED